MYNSAMCNAVAYGTVGSRPKAVGNGGVFWIVVGLLAAAAPCAWAQQTAAPAAPAREVPRPDDLEPGVNTSVTPPPAPAVPPGSSSSSRAASGADAAPNTAAPAPRAATKSSSRDKPAAQSKGDAQAASPQSPPDSKAPKSGAKAQDRLQLDATQITGNQELPKVLYIVPWKRADLGDLLGKPANSLLDEVLQPVDRDVFKRENRYYDALKPDAAGGADKAAGAAGQGSGDKR